MLGLTDMIFNYYLPGFQMSPYAMGTPGIGRGSGNVGVSPSLDPTKPHVQYPGDPGNSGPPAACSEILTPIGRVRTLSRASPGWMAPAPTCRASRP